MTYFAGLDVGLDETAICIIDGDGRIVRELKACSEPEAVVRALRALEVRYGRVGLEACPLSSRLFEGSVAAVLPVVCLKVRHLRAALAAMTHKIDRNGARGIAQVLRTGWFKAVHVRTAWSQERRTLLMARKRMLEQAFDVENTIRGLLKGHGLKVGRVPGRRSPRGSANWLPQSRCWPPRSSRYSPRMPPCAKALPGCTARCSP
jgi:transposase